MLAGMETTVRQFGHGEIEMKKIAMLCVVLMLAGCASSSVLVGTARAPIDPSMVRLYLDPPAQFEKVALLDAGSRNSWAITDQGKTNKVIERMKAEAAELGANGVLIGGMGDQQIGSVGSGSAWGSGNYAYGFGVSSGVFQKKGAGIAIYVPPGGESAPVAVAPVAQAAVSSQPVAPAAAAPSVDAQPASTAPAAQGQRYEMDPAKRCDSCGRIRAP